MERYKFRPTYQGCTLRKRGSNAMERKMVFLCFVVIMAALFVECDSHAQWPKHPHGKRTVKVSVCDSYRIVNKVTCGVSSR